MRHARAAVLLAGAAILLGLAAPPTGNADGAGTGRGPEIGIVTLAADWRDDADAIAELYAYARQAGATSTYLYAGASWPDAEPAPGAFDFTSAAPQIQASQAYGFTTWALDVPLPFYFGEPSVPADLTFVSYDDPVMIARYLAYVEALLRTYGSPSHVVLHTEGAGSDFIAGTTDFDQFCSLVGTTARFIMARFPGTLVSNYNTDYESAEISDCLNREMTWWADGLVLDVPAAEMPAAIVTRLDRVRRLAGDQPIGLIEVNYASGDVAGERTADDQARFVDAFFDYLEAHPEAFVFANWYGLFDETPAITRSWVTAQFGDLGDAFVESMIAQWSTQGLLERSGAPKPAWTRWIERTAELRAAGP
jgi:hypothetical protein